MRIDFLENAAAGTSETFKWPGGKGTFAAHATWGGGSAKLQVKLPSGTFVDVATLSANGLTNFEIPAGEVQVVAATGSAFYCYAIKLPSSN